MNNTNKLIPTTRVNVSANIKSLNAVINVDGNVLTIPAIINSDIPLPNPLFVTTSANHNSNEVPAVNIIVVFNISTVLPPINATEYI